jgi:hypothetical protein
MSASSLILPFAVQAEEIGQAFNMNMEVASIMLLAEGKRKKHSFLGSAEKTIFVSKMHYPLWFTPLRGGSLIIDGLGVSSSVFKREKVPDVQSFIMEVERGANDRAYFWQTINRHEKAFIEFPETLQDKIEALIAERDFQAAFLEYLREASTTKLEASQPDVLLPPKLDAEAASKCSGQFLRIIKNVELEIGSLEHAGRLLNQALSLHEKMILKEIEHIRGLYKEEVLRLKPTVDRNVEKLEGKRNAETSKMNKMFEKELKIRIRERERLEKKLEDLELRKAEYGRRRETCKRRNNKLGLARWEHRLRICEEKIREANRRLQELAKHVEEARKKHEADVEKVKKAYQELMQKEKSVISSLEAQCEEKIYAKKAEVEKLRLKTGLVIKKIEELINRKYMWMKEVETAILPLQIEDVKLVCIPFYLLGYEAEGKTQIQTVPPSKVAAPGGLLKTFKKALTGLTLESKVKLFLQPRTVIGKMLDSAIKAASATDEVFGETLIKTAASANLLKRHDFSGMLIRGLEELKARGWIGQMEVEALTKTYFGGGTGSEF